MKLSYTYPALLLFFISFFASSSIAQNIWSGGPTGNWNTAANWSDGIVPITTDTVQFTTDVIVSLDVNVTIKALEIQGVSGTDVVINSAGGTSLTIDGSDVNGAGLRLDEGNFELGAGITLTIRNNLNSGILVDNADTLINNGIIYIEDFEGTLDENDDGILVNNSSLFINNGTLTIDDLAIEGGGNSYMLQIANGSTFINSVGATYKAVTPAMVANVINRDGLVISGTNPTNSTVVNDGTINIGVGDPTKIERHGIYNISGNFTNNGSIIINGLSETAIINDNAGAVFTNNGTIDIDNVEDGIITISDSDAFINNNLITIGDGIDTNISDYAIRNLSIFENYAQIIINGTDDQGIYSSGAEANFTNHSTGTITIDNISSDPLLNGTGTAGGVFTNDGGRIDINQNNTTIWGGSAILFNNDDATFINQNGGIINIDLTNSDGLRSDARGDNALINTGANSVINIGALSPVGNGGTSDDGIYANGNMRNEDGATINMFGASGRGLHLTADGNFTNNNGIVNIDNCLEHALSNVAVNGNKFLNTGPNAVFNIGQNGSVGDGNTDDNAVRCDGTFENANGAILNIDNVLGGYAIDLGADNSSDPDTLINDGGIINISQNSGFIDRPYDIRVRDTCVLHNLNAGVINLSNVQGFGIHFSPQATFVNSGTVNISDYEVDALGMDNAIYMSDGTWTNDGTIRINDPNTTGYFFSHAMNIINTTVEMGPNSNIIIADASMTAGYIGGAGLYFNNCTVNNAGAITIGNGDPMRIQANGIHLINTAYTSTNTSSITINGLPVNTNGVLVTSGSFSNAGAIDIDQAHRGLYCSSVSDFANNSGNIVIGDGTTTNMGSFGIFNQTAFTNTGSITTNGTTADGIRSAHPNASFMNTGAITIDNSAANGFTNGLGSNNPSPLTNDGGTIDIGQNGPIVNIGLLIDDAGNLTNSNGGIITLGNANQVLQNEANNGNQLLNNNCAVLNIQGDFTNTGIFQNEAIVNVESGVYTFSNNIQNNGYIQDLASAFSITDRSAGTIAGVDNMGTVMSQLAVLCASENPTGILITQSPDINTVSHPTTSNWYFDANLTTLAGTFDMNTNTFTFAAVPAANSTQTLYFDVDGVGACTYVGRITVTVQDDPSCMDACPMNVSISGLPANGETIAADNTINTVGVVVIASPNMVIFKAGIQICLEAGFEVQAGADFEATIETCSGN